jgi:translation initiation factor IF-2
MALFNFNLNWINMISGTGTKRLGKIAREFNVGISTIVEFLNKKGVSIDPNPNSKIEDNVYTLLRKEYSKDLDLKKESEKLNLKAHRHNKNESITIDDIRNEDKTSNDDSEEYDDDVVFVTDRGSKKAFVKPSKPERDNEVIRPETGPAPELKVVGKIDLNPPKPQKPSKPNAPVAQVSKEETSEIKSEKPAAEPKPAVEPVVPQEQPKVETVNAAKIEPTEPKLEVGAPKEPVESPAPKAEKPQPVAFKAEVKPQSEHKAQHKPEPVKAPVVEPTQTASNQPVIEDIKTEIPKVESDIKIVGQIDLNSLNQRTRPPKKSKKQKEEERRSKLNFKKSGPAGADAGAAGTKGPDEISHKPVRLGGPTVVGKINLGDSKPGDRESTESRNAKKKRKRISKERVDLNTTDAKGPKPAVDGAPAAPKRALVLDKSKPNQQRPGGGKDGHQHGPNRGAKGAAAAVRRPIRAEVSDEDVQKQIKDTLARLTTKTKSKGSKYRREKRAAFTERLAHEEEQALLDQKILRVTEFVSANELANMMDVPVTKIISTCMQLGMFVSINQRLDAEAMALVAEEFGYKVEFISVDVQVAIDDDVDADEDLVWRAPIVTVMGHVDHGKTSLLDHIRKANVIAGEAGGITQHIGAYNVLLADGRRITFLDTPGHEAFTAMRARGAQVTDIAIIIIAADDNIMPQTIEAINHAAAAQVPIVFAINKIDKPGANPEAIKERLAQMNYLVEEWGGKYQSHDISAKSGLGVNELLEKVLLEAEMLDLKANPDRRAAGSIIESSLDKGRGYVATVLVQNGTLHEGDVILAGQYFGHVKAMFNERNQRIKEAKPGEPALILGLNGAPQAGDKFNVLENEREARQIANKREQLQREQGMRAQKHITLDEIGRRIAIGNFQELNVIVKGDVDGSIEALADSLIKLSTPEIQVNVKHKAVGQISESDVMLAAASNAIIVGFQVRPSMAARKLAEKEQIDIRLYSIIYDAIEEIKLAMEGMLSPEIKEEITGMAEIHEVFKITKVGTIAGCIVRDGKIFRGSKVRLIRDGIVIYSGELASLKRFKDDVKEVANGYECGMGIVNYNDLKEGDFIEAFKEVEVAKKL